MPREAGNPLPSHDKDLRADYGRGYEGVVILGMLESDALRHKSPTLEAETAHV